MLRINGGWTILCYLSFLFALTLLGSFKHQLCDILVIFFIGYSLITYPLFGDYPSDIYIATIRDQIFPISFYFFARSNKTKNCEMVQNAIMPLMIAYIFGIVLFFAAPGWYIDYKTNFDTTRSMTRWYNLTRFSSFWTSAYSVGYSAIFVIINTINKFVFENQKIKYFGLILFISFISLFFAQQRISIIFAIIYVLTISFVLIKKGKLSPNSFITYLFAILTFLFVIYILATNYVGKEYADYVVGRFTEKEDGLVEDRVNMFKDFVSSITFWGSGLGKYSHNVEIYGYNMPYISDCEYIRTPNEIGIFGFGIFCLIVIISLIKNFKGEKKYSFVSLIVIYYLCAMVGATPLEVSVQQPFMLWYCLGKMQNK